MADEVQAVQIAQQPVDAFGRPELAVDGGRRGHGRVHRRGMAAASAIMTSRGALHVGPGDPAGLMRAMGTMPA
jgi:hypothetical protein